MASPKHLWSGDWERESSDRTPPPVESPVEPGYGIAPEPDPEPGPRPDEQQASRRRLAVVGGLAVLIIVGVVLAITLPGSNKNAAIPQAAATTPAHPSPFGNSGNSGNSGIPTQTTPSTTTPQPTQTESNVAAGPTYDWLGMQINVTGEGVTVGSITPHSTADSAEVNPGDVIVAINTAQISSISSLLSAVKGIKSGQRFQIIVDRGTTPVTITATLTGRPSKQ